MYSTKWGLIVLIEIAVLFLLIQVVLPIDTLIGPIGWVNQSIQRLNVMIMLYLFFAPGYLLSYVIFPQNIISTLERSVIGVALSVACIGFSFLYFASRIGGNFVLYAIIILSCWLLIAHLLQIFLALLLRTSRSEEKRGVLEV